MYRNVSGQFVALVAFDRATGQRKTGDAGNMHFYYWTSSGGSGGILSSHSGVPFEIDAALAPGSYALPLTAGETDFDSILFTGVSSTSGVEIIPLMVYTSPDPSGTPAWYTAPIDESATLALIQARTNLIPADPVGYAGLNSDLNARGLTSALHSDIAALPTAADIADKVLGRNLAGGSDGGRTVQDALRFLRNRWTRSGTTLSVYAEDDSTPAWTATITVTSGASPVTESDPA